MSNPRGTVHLLRTHFHGIPWKLTVSPMDAAAANLLWEQFVWGGPTVYDDAGNSIPFTPFVQIAQRTTLLGRNFGEWYEDFCRGASLQRGPRPLKIGNDDWAKVTQNRYVFEDMAGFNSRLHFGRPEIFEGLTRRLIGIEYHSGFHHKIWKVGQNDNPYYEIQFFIRGGYGQKLTEGPGSRRINIRSPYLSEVRFQRIDGQIVTNPRG